MSTLQLEAQPRELTGRKVRQLRVKGLVPVIVYGNVAEPEVLQVPARSLERTLQGGGTSQLVELQVEGGKKHNILIRDIQRHPVRKHVMHADFYAVNMTETQVVSVSIIPINEPTNLAAGLLVLQAMDAIEIEALPDDIPAEIEIDISELDIETNITVADLPVLNGITYLAEPDDAVFTMQITREEVEEALDEEVEEGVEPEVVGKSSEDSEDEEESSDE